MVSTLTVYSHISMILLLIVAVFSTKIIAENVTNEAALGLSTSQDSLINSTASYETTTDASLFNQTRNTAEVFNVTEGERNSTSPVSTELEIETTTTASSITDLWSHFSNAQTNDEIPCVCDLLATVCDVNCCCDKQCSEEDRQTFTDCGMRLVEPDERYCFQENFVFINNTPYIMAKTSKNLFCIYTDNLKERMAYEDVSVITNPSTFEQVVDKYQMFSSPEHISNAIQTNLKVGAPIYVQFDDGSLGYLVHLRSLTSGECITSNPAAYMINVDDNCHEYITDLQRDCVQNIWLDGRTYFQGFKIIRNPEAIKNDKNITDGDLVEIAPQLCFQIFGLEIECNTSNMEDFPTPSYDEALGSCNNTATHVEYEITHNGTRGIATAIVRITLGTIGKQSSAVSPRPIKWMQNHGLVFHWANENRSSGMPIRWSGNPGYQIGAKILAGKLMSHDVGDGNPTDVRLGIQLSQDDSNWLTVLGASPFNNGHCVSWAEGSAAGHGRISVTFGQDVKTGCLLVVSLQNLTSMCTVLQNTAVDALLGWNPPDVVGAYGNSKVENPGEWVPILRQNLPSASRAVGGFACTNVIREMHVRILYANIGSLANPQPKIVGVQVRFSALNELKLRCIGRYCQSDTTSLVQSFPVTTSVTFIDVSEAAVQVYAEPPTLHAELPNDFFYPFTSTSSSLRSNRVQTLILCVTFILKILSE